MMLFRKTMKVLQLNYPAQRTKYFQNTFKLDNDYLRLLVIKVQIYLRLKLFIH